MCSQCDVCGRSVDIVTEVMEVQRATLHASPLTAPSFLSGSKFRRSCKRYQRFLPIVGIIQRVLSTLALSYSRIKIFVFMYQLSQVLINLLVQIAVTLKVVVIWEDPVRRFSSSR